MGRTLSGASYDRNDYVLQPHNGGSGCASIEELKERYGLIRPNEFNIPGGVLAYDEKGNVPVQNLPQQLITRPTTYIKGSVSIVPGGTATYKISNYSESTSYNVSFDGGSVSIVGDTITIVAGNTAGNYTLVINNEKYELAISSQAPHDVHMTVYPFKNSSDTFTIFKIDVEGVFSNDSGHFATDYQIATDKGFINLISNVEMSVNKSSIRITAPKVQTYFVRARVIDNYKQKSDWSEIFTIDLANIGIDVATPMADIGLYKDNDNIIAKISTSNYFSDSGSSFGHLTVKVCSDASLSTVVSITDITDLKLMNDVVFQSNASSLYVTTRFVSSDGKTSGWTKPISFTTSDLFSIVPAVTQQFIENPFSNQENGISYMFGAEIIYDPVNDEMLSAALKGQEAGDNSGRLAIYERRNGIWSVKQLLSESGQINNFGRNFKVSGNGQVLIVSASTAGGVSNGFVNVYNRTNGKWVKVYTINAPLGETTGSFGLIIATNNDGSIIAVAQPNYNAEVGRVYVFRKNGNAYNQSIIEAPEQTSKCRFGTDMAMSKDGSKLLISAPMISSMGGYTYLYNYTSNAWTLSQTISGKAGDINAVNIGYTLNAAEDLSRVILNDRYYTDVAGQRQGATLVYDMENGVLVYKKTIRHFDKALTNSQNGIKSRLGPDKNTIYFTGGVLDGDPGHILVFEYKNNDWVFKDSINAVAGHVKSRFGADFAIDTKTGNIFITDYLFGNDAVNGSSTGEVPGIIYYMRPQNKRFERVYSVFTETGYWTNTSQIRSINNGKYILVCRPTWKISSSSAYTGAIFIYKRINGRYCLFQRLDASTETTRFSLYFQYVGGVPGQDKFVVGTSGSISGGIPLDFYAYDTETNSFKKNGESILAPLIDGVRSGPTGEHFAFSEDGNNVFFGSYSTSTSAISGGVVYHYKLENGAWVLKQTLTDPELPGGNRSRFGNFVKIFKNGEYVAIRALKDIVNGTTVGSVAVYIFRLIGATYTQIATIKSLDYGAPGGDFGSSFDYSELTNELSIQSYKYTKTKDSCVEVFSIDGNNVKYKYALKSGKYPNSNSSSEQGDFGFQFSFNDKHKLLCVAATGRYSSNGALEFFKYENGQWVFSHEIRANVAAERAQTATLIYSISDMNEIVAVSQSGGSGWANQQSSSFFTVVS